ncbi:formate dehydrogenase accessory sulfurtransferase FdhD [Loktanella sp. M215]|uniref:formate dehydrogenase accessory sulfurtransferase FdhD n=1 Tax=Loktanella sp. M215 TaxID=2675431 RepID=UPI001EFFC90C|nr:formate dehydrogenase accessory sulfurtransferase FdhD [Loktanella sp. M215]MCF7701710.1 formate dehydrogenase accessory sulfurtransferase FdhD [Loktanella sp. M215]
MTARPELVREGPVAIVCNAVTLGVMMASPADLEDFALGFAVTEGVIRDPSELREIEIVTHAKGTEARLWLTPAAAARAAARHRAMIGPVGCGLCGIDSLDKVERELPPLSADAVHLTRAQVCGAPDLLRLLQPEHDRTHGCHAAGFLIPGRGIVLAREDVGRHNALDKLAGALLRAGIAPASGAVVLTSRVSTEMVQKAVMMGAATVIAVSTATDYAVRLADRADLTLITRVRDGRCEVLSAPHRLHL